MYTQTIANKIVYELAMLHFVSRPMDFTLKYTQELIKVSYCPNATYEIMTGKRILDGPQYNYNAYAETSILSAHDNSKNMLILSYVTPTVLISYFTCTPCRCIFFFLFENSLFIYSYIIEYSAT